MKKQPAKTFRGVGLTKHSLFPELKKFIIKQLEAGDWVRSSDILHFINYKYQLELNRRQLGWIIRALKFKYRIEKKHTSNPKGIRGWFHLKKFPTYPSPIPGTFTFYRLIKC